MRTVLVHNTDVPDSGALADYVAQQYGMPDECNYGFAMGTTATLWSFNQSAITDFLGGLWDRVQQIGARGILVCAGVPGGIRLWDADQAGNPNGRQNIGLVWFLQCLPRIMRYMAAHPAVGLPRLSGGGSGVLWTPRFPAGEGSTWADDSPLQSVMNSYRRGWSLNLPAHPILSAAVSEVGRYTEMVTEPLLGAGIANRVYSYYRDGFSPRMFGRMKSAIPVGHIGLPLGPNSTSFPGDLFDKSRAIVDAGIALERDGASTRGRARRFLFCIGNSGGVNYEGLMAASVYRAIAQGQHVKYWWRDYSVAEAEALAPRKFGLQSSGSGTDNWSVATLDSGAASQHVYDIAFGPALDNDKEALWFDSMTASDQAIIMGGQSYLWKWAAHLSDQGRFAGGMINPYSAGFGGTHHTGGEFVDNVGVLRALLDGYSLLDAGFLFKEGYHFPMGNPLAIPFDMGRYERAPLRKRPSGISFRGDWEDGLITGPGSWVSARLMAPDRFQLVTDVVRQGKYAVRVEVRPGDDPIGSSGERAEAAYMTLPNGDRIYETEDSGTQFFAFSFRLADDWVDPVPTTGGPWATILQLHGPDVLGTSPSIGFYVHDGIAGRLSVVLRGGDIESAGTTRHPLTHSALITGEWTDIVLRIRFSAHGDGAVDAWMRREGAPDWFHELSLTGVSTLQYASSVEGGEVGEHYWKHGLYRCKDASSTHVLWVDGLTRGDTFNEVCRSAFGSVDYIPPLPAAP